MRKGNGGRRAGRTAGGESSSDKFGWMQQHLDALSGRDMLRQLVPRRMCGTELVQGDRRLVNFGSNDYLGIAMDASRDAESGVSGVGQSEGTAAVGVGAGASPLVCGYTDWHERVCCLLAGLEATEAAVLFPTGFAACSGTVAALAEAGDLLLSDALNHASLIDGCRLSKAERFIYPHRDVSAVEALLRNHRHQYRRAFLITDSIFSMDGTRAPLETLVDVCERYDVIPVVDEAHGTGVFGPNGEGLCHELGVEGRVPIRIGTLSKAIGAHGGFVASRRVVIDYLIQRTRPLIYSTAAPPSVLSAIVDALEVVRGEPERRERVLAFSDRLTEPLRDAGLRVLGERTPIVPIVFGTPTRAVQLAASLQQDGFFVPAVRPPTVPEGTSRLRVSLSASHQPEQIDGLVEAILKHAQAE